MLKTAGRQSLVEEVTQNLLQRLASGVLQRGDRMPTEKELSAELGVGRSSIREAMRTLEMLNVIEIRRGIGTFVTMVQPALLVHPKHLRYFVDRQGLLDLLELRKIVEVESAALAAKRATAEEIQILREDVRALAMGVVEGRRPPEDMGFHLNIAQATHNPRFAEISRWIVAFYELDPDIPNEKDVQAHSRICEVIAMGDEDAARRAMREHLEEIESRFRIPQDDGHAHGSGR